MGMESMEKIFPWNQFEANIRDSFKKLKEDQLLFDVTLATDDGQHLQSHKMVLSAGSNFFRDIFMKSTHSSMLIYLKGIGRAELEYVLDFLYNGEVTVAQQDVELFVETGKQLKLLGLVDQSEHEIMLDNVNDDRRPCITSLEAINDSDDTFEFKDETSIKEENDFAKENANYIKSLVLDNDDEIFDFKDETLFKVEGKKVQIDKKKEAEQQIQDMVEMKDGEWNCKMCGKIMAKESYIKRHAETHTIGMLHACHICSKTFVVKSNLHTHISQIHTKLFNCDICEKTGMNKQSYRMHKLRRHRNMPISN